VTFIYNITCSTYFDDKLWKSLESPTVNMACKYSTKSITIKNPFAVIFLGLKHSSLTFFRVMANNKFHKNWPLFKSYYSNKKITVDRACAVPYSCFYFWKLA
jgi:hypothetical protein